MKCYAFAEESGSKLFFYHEINVNFIYGMYVLLRGQEGRYKATWKRKFKLPWREAGPPNDLDDTVDSDQ